MHREVQFFKILEKFLSMLQQVVFEVRFTGIYNFVRKIILVCLKFTEPWIFYTGENYSRYFEKNILQTLSVFCDLYHRKRLFFITRAVGNKRNQGRQ